MEDLKGRLEAQALAGPMVDLPDMRLELGIPGTPYIIRGQVLDAAA